MFFDKQTEDEFFAALDSGMKKNASFEKNLIKDQINKAINHLSEAAESLRHSGLTKEAEMVMVLKDVCNSDESMKGLTSDKMLKNLEEKGWVFNADDADFEDEEDVELE